MEFLISFIANHFSYKENVRDGGGGCRGLL